MTNRQRALVILGLVVSLGFLWAAFNGLNPAAVWAHIRTADFGWLAAGVVVFFISLVLIALRWQYLLRAIRLVPLGYLAGLVSICYMGNNVYPLRMGEVLRIVLLQRDYRVPMAKTTTTIFVERMFDGVVMLTFIVLPLLFVDIASPELRMAVKVTAPIFLSALVVFLVLAAKPGILRRLVSLVSRPLPGGLKALVLRLGEDVIGGLDALRTPRNLAGAVASSFATWVFNALVYWLVSFAFHLDIAFPVMLTIVGVVNLAGAFPVSPGQVGVFEFLVSRVLVATGIPEGQAIAYALVVHVVIWLPVTLYGFYLLARRGLGWQAITHARELEQTAISS